MARRDAAWDVLRYSVYALGAVLLALFLAGLEAWRRHRNARLLEAAARMATAALIGAVMGWYWSRGYPPGLAREIWLYLIRLGALVGIAWAIVGDLLRPKA